MLCPILGLEQGRYNINDCLIFSSLPHPIVNFFFLQSTISAMMNNNLFYGDLHLMVGVIHIFSCISQICELSVIAKLSGKFLEHQ